MPFGRVTIQGQDFSAIIDALIKKGVSARFRVTGTSMLPSIRAGDVIHLSPFQGRVPEIGDVVARMADSHQSIVIHRIIKIQKQGYLIKGDSLFRADGLFHRESIIGFVSGIQRGNREILLDKAKRKRDILLSTYRIFCFHRLADRVRKIWTLVVKPSK